MKLTRQEAAQYLAGVFDGEGWVVDQESHRPHCGIGNTDLKIIDACREALDLLDIEYRMQRRDFSDHRKTLHIIYIGRRKALHRFTELVPVRSEKAQRLQKANSRKRFLFPEERPIQEIRRLYWDEGLSWNMVAERLGISMCALKSWVVEAGIPSRTRGEARRRFLERTAT